MKLNCKVGDLAITIRCHVPDNLGKIVQIIAYEGLQEWPNYPDPIPVWLIRAYSGSKSLSYLYPDGTLQKSNGGLAPDCFLRPITPPKGHLSGNEDVDNAIQESTDSSEQLASS